jgi:hypothetical protein
MEMNSVTAQHPLQNTPSSVFLRFCCSAPPSPRHHAFCFDLVVVFSFLFCMVVTGEVGFLPKEKLTEFNAW